MKINKILEAQLREAKINPDDAIPYLLSIYFNYKPTYIPEDLKVHCQVCGLIDVSDGVTTLKVPLFEDAEVEVAWDWVKTEYIQMFKDIGNGGYVSECKTRMKKLFSQNPDIRKNEVLGATRLYLSNVDKRYVRKPHYFIEKGVGSEKTQDILTWVETYREENSNTESKSKLR